MYTLELNEHFLRKYAKLVKKNQGLEAQVQKILLQLQEDPRQPSLRCHKVGSVVFGNVSTCKVTGDIRILWNYSKHSERTLIIYDIGGHSGGRKVYSVLFG